MSKLSPEELFNVLFEDVDNSDPCIIYMGIGTHCNSQYWEREKNQQMPNFLHDWKINSFDVPIKIILFDYLTKDEPYIVKLDTDNFYSGTFIQDSRYSNVYNSGMGIQVYSFGINVTWENDRYNMNGTYDITNLVACIVKKVTNSNHLFFFHEFTGRNPEDMECQIKEMIDYDESKICIDISRGRDLSCCVNFSEPENFPLIELRNGSIKWINPKLISFEKKEHLIDTFENKINQVKKDFLTESDFPYQNTECSIFVDHKDTTNNEIYDYYLYKQIINCNKQIYDACRKNIYGLKNFYDIEKEFTKEMETCIINIKILKLKINNFSGHYDNMIVYVSKIKETKEKELIYVYKLALIQEFYNMIQLCLSHIKPIDINYFDELFLQFDNCEDKYKITDIFRKFCIEQKIVY